MINGEQSLCGLWSIHHVSQEVGPRGTEMNEETLHVAAGKEELTKETAPDLLSYRIQNHQIASFPSQHLSAPNLIPLRQPSLSSRGTKEDKPFLLYLCYYWCTLRKEKKASVY